jgi:GntP family gluconate:H+ symporter
MITIIALIIVMVLLIIATTKYNVHPFLTLILAAMVMGFVSGLDGNTVILKVTEGFGNTLKSIGIIIAFGTIIGAYLEKSGGAQAMASSILKIVGDKNSPLAMNLTGFIVSIPVFCDSGFVILSALNKALSKKTGIPLAILAVSLSTGLYATHVFVPPTPGPLAAAGTLGADIGLVLLLGLVVAIPSALAGWLWARHSGKNISLTNNDNGEVVAENILLPGTYKSFAPIVVPIILIALKSIADYPSAPFGGGIFYHIIIFVGNPVVALLIGVFLAFSLKSKKMESTHFHWVANGLKNAGVIILITGAGGAFGNVLRATDIGDTLGSVLTNWQVGLLLPFLLAAVLKSAQGSSTVAIITSAALIVPLLEPLGMTSEVAKALVVLAIGAGAMTVSHVNDSYFWVVSQFSNMNTAIALRSHTLATLFQGITGIVIILILSVIII